MLFCMPDAKSVTMLFRRFKMSSRGGNGFTSLNDSAISVSDFGITSVHAGPVGASAATPFASPSDLLSKSCAGSDTVTTIDCLDAELIRLAKTRRYVRLRSFLNVSWKKNTKNTRFAIMSAASDQNKARQLNACVNNPPRIGPRDGPIKGAA